MVIRNVGNVSKSMHGLTAGDKIFIRGPFGTTFPVDEAMTPDSSRFWSVAEYKVGASPPSFDKQFVRDYLLSVKWNKTPPAPHLPAEVINGTSNRYREAYRLVTGSKLG